MFLLPSCGLFCFCWFPSETRANERAALVVDISSSVDRNVRRGMADTVATPLANLVVNTARQVVADPLQVPVVFFVCVCVAEGFVGTGRGGGGSGMAVRRVYTSS